MYALLVMMAAELVVVAAMKRLAGARADYINPNRTALGPRSWGLFMITAMMMIASLLMVVTAMPTITG